jgi:hypothetical protein
MLAPLSGNTAIRNVIQKRGQPRVVQVALERPRSYDSFLLAGLASKSVLPGVRTSYSRGIGKLSVMSALGRNRGCPQEMPRLRAES